MDILRCLLIVKTPQLFSSPQRHHQSYTDLSPICPGVVSYRKMNGVHFSVFIFLDFRSHSNTGHMWMSIQSSCTEVLANSYPSPAH